ncbi:acyl-CoA--sterol O-acyltransferase 1-like [Salvia miltiorrhiza]|uniref:acyl-CoA--sterol O-acyltransferase 1-like n=1 Tax=Salvia miltiorrhiza TaxID=226208 RepID=UPI0025ACE89A|nr:acyl-CoA--sterol O-acyltransferase 1-like [Salvia miltiorrhiza]
MMLPLIIEIVKHHAEGEITNFIKVWSLVFASLSYCFFLSKVVPGGVSRFLAIIPVLILNLILPLSLHTMHLGGSSAFFLVWLANFKLIMLAFGKGPLSDPSISLPKFAAFACLPIKSHQITDPGKDPAKRGLKSFWNYLAKALLICLFVKMYDYTDLVHPKLTWVLYSLHIYCGLEIILATFGGLAKALIGIELEPQFDEPYLSASLQEFWGRRWNIMVSKILRPTVYEPVLKCASRITGRRWAPLPAMVGSFMVSGLMHELIFYYLGRRLPTGELTAFFMLHGVCLAAEVAAKKLIGGRWRPPRLITGPLTIGFVMATAFWLFFPEFLRCDAVHKALAEYAAVEAFVKDVTYAFASKSAHNNTPSVPLQ